MQTIPAAPITRISLRVTLRHELLGWPGAVHFELEPIEGDEVGMFAILRCTDEVTTQAGHLVEELAFVVVAPGMLYPDYSVVLPEPFADALDLEDADDAALLALVTQRTPLERSTVNLFSPVVVNRRTGVADQYVPACTEDEAGWRLQTPMPATPGDPEKEDAPHADAHP